jgi:predicted RNase H-like nuclease
MAEDRYVGVTWSDGAWLAVAFTADGYDRTDVFDGIGDCWAEYEDDIHRMVVGVPIGLVESGDPTRRCDELARNVLGPRSDAIPDPPVREATKKRRYSPASRIQKRKTGSGLAEAAFEQSDAIAMCDELLQEVPEAAAVIHGSHPELCFRAFAGEELSHPGRVAAGYAERMRSLATHDRDAPPIVQNAAEATTGETVSVLDVLDATALAYTARPGPGSLRTLPAEPETDPTGLPVELVYRAETALPV